VGAAVGTLVLVVTEAEALPAPFRAVTLKV
jgi:hypothetical protein